MLGDGSDGDLHVTNGQTVNLLLDHKYQFKSITIDAGGIVTTNSTVGSVLYLLCTGAVNIAGSILLNNKVNPGKNTWSVTIDGTTFTSPGVNNGGIGEYYVSLGPTVSIDGFGSGGGGGGFGSAVSAGGNGGANGGAGGGISGDTYTGNTMNNTVYAAGGNGGISAGGGGGSYAYWQTTAGPDTGFAVGNTGAVGGSAYGQNGGDGSNPPGRGGYTNNRGDTSGTNGYGSAGGGGAGGSAGRPGVHLVMKGSEVNFFSTMVLNVSGSDGQKGGNGGITYTAAGPIAGGLGGGGGGGGNSGSYFVYYGAKYTSAGSAFRNGGNGGAGGLRGYTNAASGGNGAGGAGGVFNLTRSAANYGNMMMMFN